MKDKSPLLQFLIIVVCLLLFTGCGTTPRARQANYRELSAWLAAHALPAETVAVQEHAAWARLTARHGMALPLTTLPPGGDAAELLTRLDEMRPDYCVALRSIAWEGVQANPWFRERYQQVASTTVIDDPAAPLTLYRYIPSPFDAGETLRFEHTLYEENIGHITLESVQISRRRLEIGEPVYVSLTLSGNVREPLRAAWQVRAQEGEHIYLHETRALPTDSWPITGTVTERFVIFPPDVLPHGDYALELSFTRPNLAPFGAAPGEVVMLTTLFRPPDVTQTPPAPDHPLEIAVGDAIALVGYDAPQRLAPGETLHVALYWQALRPPAADWMVFVHLFSPDGTLASQVAAFPVYWTYPTTVWQPGDYIRDVHLIPLDEKLPHGDYHVHVGMYDPATEERLALRDAEGAPLSDDTVKLLVLQVR